MKKKAISPFVPVPSRIGMPADLFKGNPAVLQQFILANRLQEIKVAAGAPAKAGVIIINPNIFGGIKVMHLHCGDKVYQLNEKQWADFSAKFLQQCKTVLGQAQSVSFENALELGTALHGVAAPARLGLKKNR